jgi:4-hydroxy-2-oxovalerate aldolase
MSERPDRPALLDCTIRDGSYAIDFKFTAADTGLIAGLLDEAGLRWIEIGHGLGLGASAAGKGRAASDDRTAIEASRAQVRTAQLGAFFIPDIGTSEDLRDAVDAGLDFIRIGHNADEMAAAMPSVELARELGLHVFVNFMKTYGITPEDFARASAMAVEHGAQGVYVVDSAGGMLPGEVAAYVEATRAVVDVPIGFHGHSNLHLAVANSIAAWEAGAELVDTSVSGIGRSSGNVPTEVMAAVFERLGVDCGVDALAVMDIAEAYLAPLAEHLHPHTMTAVALGYGRFHSSYLPRALRAAEEAGVNPLRLIVALGREDMMRLPDDLLAREVAALRDTPAPQPTRGQLDRFSHPGFGPRRIGNRRAAVDDLLEGLEVVAAKRHLAVVLDLVASAALEEEELAAEFVLEDETMALGRVRFGAADVADAALAPHADRIGLALVAPGTDLPALRGRLVPYDAAALALEYLGDVALARLAAQPADRVLVVDAGGFPPAAVDALAARLGATRATDAEARPDALVVVAGHISEAPGDGVLAFAGPTVDPDPARGLLAREDALRGTLARWRRALDAVPVPHPVA